MNDPADDDAEARAVEIAQAFLRSETEFPLVLLDASQDREKGPGFWVVTFAPEPPGKYQPGLTMVEVNLQTREACFFSTL
jgi:hypothetical protein